MNYRKYIIESLTKATMKLLKEDTSTQQISINIVNAVANANLMIDEEEEYQLIEDLMVDFDNDGENIFLEIGYDSWDEYHSEVTGNNYERMSEMSDNSSIEDALKTFNSILLQKVREGIIGEEDKQEIMNNIKNEINSSI